MKSILLLFLVLISTASLSQEALSTANGKIIIDIFMNGYKTGDTLKMKSVMHSNMTMQRAYLDKEQQNVLIYIKPSDLLKYAATTGQNQEWEEKLTDYVVSSDGNLAHVWTPYEFYTDGKFSHCGANSLTLV